VDEEEDKEEVKVGGTPFDEANQFERLHINLQDAIN